MLAMLVEVPSLDAIESMIEAATFPVAMEDATMAAMRWRV